MENANELLGLLHGAYGAGGTISPLIATAMVTKGDWPWYTFYYMMAGLAVIELLVCTLSFRKASGAIHRAASARNDSGGGSTTKEALENHITWICAFFLLCYVGVEVALGGVCNFLEHFLSHADKFFRVFNYSRAPRCLWIEQR
ncbi:hypothetical protein LCER1_G000379 [Lachnellula cervina]|uniref:Bypass of stop codon protein 6 n=1 Tax=Lachnellula cervina TaxID=1316786 RepID=A0A7D8Z4L0_9HELO|nr:hypothetical protein LCER1_G000379 [Lachnellula cervina]